MYDMKVIDKFLPEIEFEKLRKIVIEDNDMPWYFNDTINVHHDITDNKCYFTHHLFNRKSNYLYSNFFHHFNTLFDTMEVKALMRVKVNCYPRTEKVEIHEEHIDMPFTHKGAVFYLNTCDGYTIIEGKKVESLENRIVFFDPSLPHTSTSCSNTKARFNININYF